MKKYLVLGSGRSALAILEFLRLKDQHAKIYIYDDNQVPNETKNEISRFGGICLAAGNLASIPKGPGLFFPSPGISPAAEVSVLASSLGWKPESDISYVMNLVPNSIGKIGITGTNGKSTVTKMIEHILRAEGVNAIACGNIGVSPARALIDDSSIEVFVIELSSYQLEWSGPLELDLAVFTSFSIDHLERHKTLENYFDLKLNAFRGNQLRRGFFDSSSFTFLKSRPIATENFSKFGEIGGFFSETVALESISAEHDLLNATLALSAVSEWLGKPVNELLPHLNSFNSLPHRFTLVEDTHQRRLVNDSKATNIACVALALKNCQSPLLLLMGGMRKNESLDALLVSREKINVLVTYGQDGLSIARELRKLRFPVVKNFKTCKAALYYAEAWSKLQEKKATVLFSPGCASFDEFKNFEERGEFFTRFFASASC